MIRAVVWSTFPFEHSISSNPDDMVADAIIDILEGKGWTTFSTIQPPKISARVKARLYMGEDLVIVVECPRKDFEEVRRWMIEMGLLDPPVPATPRQSMAEERKE